MASTKLKGKTQRRRSRVEREQLSRKNQAFMPVIKKVDVEELKSAFKPVKKETKKTEEKTTDTPKAEKED